MSSTLEAICGDVGEATLGGANASLHRRPRVLKGFVVFVEFQRAPGQQGDSKSREIEGAFLGVIRATFAAHGPVCVQARSSTFVALFSSPTEALDACFSVQKRLLAGPPSSSDKVAAWLRIGVYDGDVTQAGAELFGLGVDGAGALAKMARAGQVVLTEGVKRSFVSYLYRHLEPLGPVFVLGLNDTLSLFKIDLKRAQPSDGTLLGVTMSEPPLGPRLELRTPEIGKFLGGGTSRVVVGRDTNSTFCFSDRSVSRLHAVLEWCAGEFTLTDLSTAGTWVYGGNSDSPLFVRHRTIKISGVGRISFARAMADPTAPHLDFTEHGR